MTLPNTTLLQVRNLSVHFPIYQARQWPWQPVPKLKAVNGVDFVLNPGETLGIVGESGCGKSTLARALIKLVNITAGQVIWHGNDLAVLDKKSFQEKRRDIQMVFQDPLASLDPRMTIGDIIAEPLRTYHPELSRADRKSRVQAIMEKVGLLPNVINRYPHEFSGGQCQRVGIARALILEPKLIICDEPVSALDVSIQAQIINLLKDIQQEMGLALIFIAHDLAVVRHIADKVMVMYLGRVMESGDTQSLFDHPQHPYTRALMSAAPIPDPKIERSKSAQLLTGELPSPISPPSGCVFRTRCPLAESGCAASLPELQGQPLHQVACIKAG